MRRLFPAATHLPAVTDVDRDRLARNGRAARHRRIGVPSAAGNRPVRASRLGRRILRAAVRRVDELGVAFAPGVPLAAAGQRMSDETSGSMPNEKQSVSIPVETNAPLSGHLIIARLIGCPPT